MEFTGERYIPELEMDSEISIFHMQRYKSILNLCKGKKVLDAASGEGYGTFMIANYADSAVGVDISQEAVNLAREKYVAPNIQYIQSSVTDLPLEDGTVDVVVSFETIEHISEGEQKKFLCEIKRVLKKDGVLIMSSPDKKNYSDIPDFHNKYHVHELYFSEFDRLLKGYFDNVTYYYQGMFCNSYLYNLNRGLGEDLKRIELEKPGEESRAEYIVAICSEIDQYDISSVIYDEYNKYYKMRDEILVLKERLGDPGKIIEQKENYICEQREKIMQLEQVNRDINAIVEQKENYICEQREKIAQLDRANRDVNVIVEQKENYIREQREKIAQLDQVNRDLKVVVEQKENYICEQREKIAQLEQISKSIIVKIIKKLKGKSKV